MPNYKLNKEGKPIVPWGDLDISSAKHSGENSMLCPNCSHTRMKKNVKSFQVNISKGMGQCHHCGAVSFDDDNSSSKPFVASKKSYRLPDITKYSKVTERALEWFKTRSITSNTLEKCGIKSSNVWMPQHKDRKSVECILFPYTINKVVVNTKFRGPEKAFKLESNAKLIFYGLDDIKGCDTAIVVEGEIDKLSMYEAGFKNVLSTPNGAPTVTDLEKLNFQESGSFNSDRVISLEYIDNSIDQISHIKKWIIAVDEDIPGKRLEQELIRRFGAEKCSLINFGEFKDANEVLVNDGIMALQKCVEEAEEVPLEKITTCEDVKPYLTDILENGYPLGLGIGVEAFDRHYKQRLSELDVHVGGANQGKSWWLFWLMLVMSVKHGWKWGVYVPENSPPGEFFRILIQMLVGKGFLKNARSRISELEMLVASDWINDHFFVVDYADEDTIINYDMILDKFRGLVFRNGINGALIDPLNDLDMTRGNGVGIDEFYQKMLGKIRKFKQRHNLKFHLSVHPVSEADRMTEKHEDQGQRPKVIELSEISGGSIFKNRVDNGISVYRNFWDASVSNDTEIHVKKIKWQESVGTPTLKKFPIIITYNKDLYRFTCDNIDPIEGFFEKMFKESVYPDPEEMNFDPLIDDSHKNSIDTFESEGDDIFSKDYGDLGF